MWCELGNSQPSRILLYNMPDHFLCNPRSPDCTCAANTAEDLTLCCSYPCHRQPFINRLLHPFRHRHCTDVPSFPDEVNNGPMVFPALKVVNGDQAWSSAGSIFSLSFFVSWRPPPDVGSWNRMNRRCPQWLDIGAARGYQR